MKLEPKPRRSAYGGSGWKPRTKSLREELGEIWRSCGISNEWGTLKTVLLHRPGLEIEGIRDPDEVQFVETPNAEEARRQHDAIAQAYRDAGIEVIYLSPAATPPPNQLFAADLFLMTPEGAILGRPASRVRAGEEVEIARRLSGLGIPILSSIGGSGTFEGADAAWIARDKVLLGFGFRTNAEGAAQVRDTLRWQNVEVIPVELPSGAMHLMGILRFVDAQRVLAWPHRLPDQAVTTLTENGYEVLFIPDESEAIQGHALNFVTLGPGKILAPAGNPTTLAFYGALGINCQVVDVSELTKCAGAIGCLTGILERSED